jgi:hypothetical protein
MKVPMREKYVDEAAGIWMIFGEHPDGTVDVNDGNRDVFVGIPKEAAEKIVEAHYLFMKDLYEILCK